MFNLMISFDGNCEDEFVKFEKLADAVVYANEVASRRCQVTEKGLVFRKFTDMYVASSTDRYGEFVAFEIEEVA